MALTEEVPAGGVRAANACGKQFVVWRSTAPGSAAVVMDPSCPHLGANLAEGGVVANGCLRCPFHGWSFDTEGALVHVPGADLCPTHVTLRRYDSRERNGVVSVWISCDDHDGRKAPLPSDAAELAPNYSIPAFPQLNGGPQRWTYHGLSEHIVRALLWEIPENGSDVAHLPALHSGFVMPSWSPLFGHAWSATWEAITAAAGAAVAGELGGVCDGGAPASGGLPAHLTLTHPFARIRIKEVITVAGVSLPGEVDVTILQAGPTQVFLRMDTPVGPLFVVETVTPIAPMRLRVLHAVYGHPALPRIVALAVLSATVRQFERDIPVWENKRYEPRPILSKADKAIAAYRRWTTQFWTPAAVTFEEATRAHVAREMGLPADAKLEW